MYVYHKVERNQSKITMIRTMNCTKAFHQSWSQPTQRNAPKE